MISRPYKFLADGAINSDLKLLIDDGAHDLGPDGLTVVPNATAGVGVNGFVGNGASSFATIGTVADLTFPQNVGILTAAAWVRMKSLATSFPFLRSATGFSNNGLLLVYIQATNTFTLLSYTAALGSAAGWRVDTTSITPVIDTWLHFAVTYDYPSSVGAWYLNGAPVAVSKIEKRALTTGNAQYAMNLGGHQDDSYFAHGNIRGLRLWSGVKTASQVRYLYETERPAFGL